MKIIDFLDALPNSLFTGVPDSLLAPLCAKLNSDDYVNRHIVAANEGNAIGIAAGYHLATGNVPIVYMQNSGIGNAVNPITSLLNDKVYGIPCIFIIGWRGKPGIYDEPQHIFQGEITLEMLNMLDIENFVVDNKTTALNISEKLKGWQSHLDGGKSVAFVMEKGSLTNNQVMSYQNNYTLNREEVIKRILLSANDCPVLSTTGKISREVYETRENDRKSNDDISHRYDFLSVGSMGHTSSIALGLALNLSSNKKVWCIEGDGAVIMHTGAMATIGAKKPNNLIHIVLNNAAHESVGGMPTVADKISFTAIAFACGYENVYTAETMDELDYALEKLNSADKLSFLEVKCAINSREDLARPTSTPAKSKVDFMEYIKFIQNEKDVK